MNKQAFTFLTLFSLILVLSIYYIMLPPISKQETVSTPQTTIEQLQETLDNKRKEIINKNNDIIAKESSTSNSISQALETISQTKNLSEKEQSIVSKIKELGYQEAYVEIDQQIIKATVLKKDASKQDASKVIQAILNLMNNEYQVEVKFVDQ